MNAARAVDLVGGCGGPIFLRNMALALSLHPWLNTPEETERLKAARWALDHPKQFAAEKQKRLDARGKLVSRVTAADAFKGRLF